MKTDDLQGRVIFEPHELPRLRDELAARKDLDPGGDRILANWLHEIERVIDENARDGLFRVGF